MGVPYAEVIGDPIAHSKSPLIHNFWLERLGLDGEYRRWRVSSANLHAYLRERQADPDWRGCNVTIPHKQAVLALVDRRTREAEEAGAANTIAHSPEGLLASNGDVLALERLIVPSARECTRLGMPVVLVGAGGAARAVLHVLLKLKGIEVLLLNRSIGKARDLLEEFGLAGRAGPIDAPLPSTGLIINASSLGMTGYPPLALDLPATDALVFDLVYSPLETLLLKQARERGMRTQDGLAMLIGQAELAFERFFHVAPPSGTEPELREMLVR